MEDRIKILEEKVEVLTNKLNEVISCLSSNDLYQKVSVDFIYPEEEDVTEEDTEASEEVTEQATEE